MTWQGKERVCLSEDEVGGEEVTDTLKPDEADRYFDVNGLRLHARTWSPTVSTTRPLVILHGMDESWRTFALVAPRFAQTRHVHAIDLRGHGDSEKPDAGYRLTEYAADVLGLLPQLGGSVDLLDHSLGALVALLVARAQPDAVTHLVLEDPPILVPGDEAVLRHIGTLSRALKQQQSLQATIDALTPAHASYPPEWIEMNARDIMATAIGSFDGLLSWEDDPLDWEELLPGITVPTLVLAPEAAATEGFFVGKRRALFERLLPSARIVTFPVNAHHLTVHAPDDYVATVEAFLRDA